jgi:hypothetical protein
MPNRKHDETEKGSLSILGHLRVDRVANSTRHFGSALGCPMFCAQA